MDFPTDKLARWRFENASDGSNRGGFSATRIVSKQEHRALGQDRSSLQPTEPVLEQDPEQIAGPAVILDSVVKEYIVDGAPVKALDGVSLDIRRAEMVAILGPSGAGKTTLLNLIAGLERPSSGEVKVLGLDLAGFDENSLASFRANNIGFIFQSYNLVSTLTARENVELMMELAGWSDPERNEKLSLELVSQVGLASRANHLPGQLSGGEQQRVAIARALANGPSLVLADEPTGNLDAGTGLEIIQLLTVLREKNSKTVIITTHDERIVDRADAVVRLDKGRLAGVDRPVRVRS